MRRRPPTQEARDHLLIIGVLKALGDVGTPLSDERRADVVAAFEAALKMLYPRPDTSEEGKRAD